ncbi:MAG TPA: hypothetical protein VJS66_07815 [Burkholderiales bacterium]|nr:hypothetical protein [Burkholderiales bacterium]
MTAAEVQKQLPEGFDRLNLEPGHFHIFYTVFSKLRFPLNVAEVLDLRYLINHAVDEFSEPPLTPDYRQFRESLEKALDALSVENPRHRDRLLKTIALIRDLHVAHSLDSRNSEERLRLEMDDNRHKQRTALRKGIFYSVATLASIAGWFAVPGIEWAVQLLSLLCAVQSLLCFRSLPRLETRREELRSVLNNVLQDRVNTINWKMMIHKLTLILGFKQIQGVEVFRMEGDTTTVH